MYLPEHLCGWVGACVRETVEDQRLQSGIMPPKRMVDRSAEHGTKRARQRLNHTANAVSALNSTSRTHEPPLQVQNAPGFPVQRAETSNWRTQHIPSLKTSHVPRPSASANRHLPIGESGVCVLGNPYSQRVS